MDHMKISSLILFLPRKTNTVNAFLLHGDVKLINDSRRNRRRKKCYGRRSKIIIVI